MADTSTQQQLLDALIVSRDYLNVQISTLTAAIKAANGGSTTQPATPTIPDAVVGTEVTITKADGKVITTDGTFKIAVNTMVAYYNGRTTPVMLTADGVTLTTREAGADTDKAIAALVGKKLKVITLPTTTTTTSPTTGGGTSTSGSGGTDTPSSAGYPVSATRVGSTSVAVFTNEDWTNGVWTKTSAYGVAMPAHPMHTPGTVLLFSDGTLATIATVQEGSTNNSVWLDKRPDPAAIGKNNLVTIVSTTYAPATGSTNVVKIGARGSKRSLVKGGKIRVNHGQSGGGDLLRLAKMDYAFATEADIKACAAAGFEGVRISLLWERLLWSLSGEIDTTYGNQLLAALKLYGKYFGKGSVLICQAHNYAGYSFTNSESNRIQLGTQQVPQGSLAYLTKKLTAFILADKEAAAAVYGLDFMNEPINLSSFDVIFNEYQLCIDELRKQNQTWVAAVETYQWATTVSCDATFAKLATLNDPANLLEIHTHCYFDPDHGGDYAEADNLSTDSTFMDKSLALAKSTGKKHAYGEMGAPSAKRVGGQNVDAPITTQRALEGFEKALAAGSDVYWWWWSEYQANDGDNVNSISAKRNATMLAGLQQYMAVSA